MMMTFRSILEGFTNAVSLNVARYASRGLTLALPSIPVNQAVEICRSAKQIFQEEPVMLEVESPCTVIGDLHGHILDLFRILTSHGYPPRRKYVFLGDLVDRGEFSIETVLVVFLLKILFPSHVYVIRGNHEFSCLCDECGFRSQSVTVYGDTQFYDACLSAFSVMPISALVDKQILCVHGGIGPETRSLDQFRAINRPIFDFDDDFLNSTLWSDPSAECYMYVPSSRGTGHFFGAQALTDFMKRCNLSLIIRGHECVMGGTEWFFDKKLVTVFSASNYCGVAGNESAILDIEPGNKYIDRKFPPLDYLRRTYVMFRKFRPQLADNSAGFSRRFSRDTSKSSSNKDLPPTPHKLSRENRVMSGKQLPRLEFETKAYIRQIATPIPPLSPAMGQRAPAPTIFRPPTTGYRPRRGTLQ